MDRAPSPGETPAPRAGLGPALVPSGVGGLRLNIGCGDVRGGPGWLNCDSWPGVGPDVCFDATRPWPFGAAVADRIYLGQVIEHLAYPLGVRAALYEAHRALRPGGECVVVTPDFIAHVEKNCPPDVVANETRGRGRWPGDWHRWKPDRHTVVLELERQFPNVRVVHPQSLDHTWPAGTRDLWDCCVIGKKDEIPSLIE